MKILIQVLCLVAFVNLATAQSNSITESKKQLQKIEKQIQEQGKDEKITKMASQEKELKSKIRARLDALEKSDATLKSLSQQMNALNAEKDSHLRASNEEYKMIAGKIDAAERSKALAMVETKEKQALKKEENAKKQALRKEETAKKQALKKEEIAKKQALKKQQIAKKQEKKKQEIAKKKAIRNGNG